MTLTKRVLKFGLPGIFSVLLAVAVLGPEIASGHAGSAAQPKASSHQYQPRLPRVAGVLYLISEHVPTCASLAGKHNTRAYQQDDCGFYVGLERQYEANAAKGGPGVCHYAWYVEGAGNAVGLAGSLGGKVLMASDPALSVTAFLFAEGTWYFCH
jgi:hypothetical protein